VWDASAELWDVTFIGNVAGESGGGVAIDGGSTAVISGTHVISNTADGYGGGIAIWDGAWAVITGTQIYANTAINGSGGGIGAEENGNLILSGSWVVGNAALDNQGGGITAGSGSSYVDNSVIAGNFAGPSGGGFWLTFGGSHRVVNCHIVGNQTDDEGAAIAAAYAARIEVTNTLIISNTGETGIADRDGSGSVFLLNYSDTYGNSPDGTDGVTINRTDCLGTPPADGLDPLLAGGALPGGVGPAAATQWMSYDYHLQAGSPAIDAGTPVGAPATDIEGTPRDVAPDMGAFEWVCRVVLPLILRSS
jgi:predicted outer membrane repeat protein